MRVAKHVPLHSCLRSKLSMQQVLAPVKPTCLSEPELQPDTKTSTPAWSFCDKVPDCMNPAEMFAHPPAALPDMQGCPDM
jgi:hypothetical protein